MFAYSATFESAEAAQKAIPALNENGIPSGDILVLEPSEGQALEDAIKSAMDAGFVTGPAKNRTRAVLGSGSTLMIVKVPFGQAWRALDAMEDHGGVVLASLGLPPRRGFLTDVFGPMVINYHPTGASAPPKPVTRNMGPMIVQPKAGRTSSLGIPLLSKGPLTGFIPLVINYKPRG